MDPVTDPPDSYYEREYPWLWERMLQEYEEAVKGDEDVETVIVSENGQAVMYHKEADGTTSRTVIEEGMEI